MRDAYVLKEHSGTYEVMHCIVSCDFFLIHKIILGGTCYSPFSRKSLLNIAAVVFQIFKCVAADILFQWYFAL